MKNQMEPVNMNTYIFFLLIKWEGKETFYSTWIEAENAKKAEEELDFQLGQDTECPEGLYEIKSCVIVPGKDHNITVA
jgi:hypothetical protein